MISDLLKLAILVLAGMKICLMVAAEADIETQILDQLTVVRGLRNRRPFILLDLILEIQDFREHWHFA
jgi:hypothetical protein